MEIFFFSSCALQVKKEIEAKHILYSFAQNKRKSALAAYIFRNILSFSYVLDRLF